MVEIHFIPIKGRIKQGNLYLPAAYIYDGTIIIDNVQQDSVIMISPFGIGMMMGGHPDYMDLDPEDAFTEILEDLICHELSHEFVDWTHETAVFSIHRSEFKEKTE